ncbi:MAG: hypothetical protein ACRENP_21140 [Longimicrobiales bacterium]
MAIFARDVNEQGVLVMLDANAVHRIAFFFQAAYGPAAENTAYERGPARTAPARHRNGMAARVCHRDNS